MIACRVPVGDRTIISPSKCAPNVLLRAFLRITKNTATPPNRSAPPATAALATALRQRTRQRKHSAFHTVWKRSERQRQEERCCALKAAERHCFRTREPAFPCGAAVFGRSPTSITTPPPPASTGPDAYSCARVACVSSAGAGLGAEPAHSPSPGEPGDVSALLLRTITPPGPKTVHWSEA